MAGLAEGLPVGTIPEQGLVTVVGDDVVDHRSSDYQPGSVAVHAQWMICQMHQPRLLPGVVVASLVGRGLPSSPCRWRRGAHPVTLSRHTIAKRLQSCHGLLTLAALDLRVDLISAGIEQVDGPILQRPKVAVQRQVVIAIADPLARHHFRRFQPYR